MHPVNLAVGGAASPKERDERTRFDPVEFPHDRAVRPHIEHHDRIQTLNVDAEILASELKRAIKGEVRFDDGSRALYATDASRPSSTRCASRSRRSAPPSRWRASTGRRSSRAAAGRRWRGSAATWR